MRALEAAETDTEKFATLFLVPKLVRGSDCDKTARLYLMKVSFYFKILLCMIFWENALETIKIFYYMPTL